TNSHPPLIEERAAAQTAHNSLEDRTHVHRARPPHSRNHPTARSKSAPASTKNARPRTPEVSTRNSQRARGSARTAPSMYETTGRRARRTTHAAGSRVQTS
ncbi:hypothetical protein BD410DRAFT_846208, partial [Rickenella mellea]